MVVGALIIAGCAVFAFIALPDRADDDPEFETHADADVLETAALEPRPALSDA
jgi:hypothetical protein